MIERKIGEDGAGQRLDKYVRKLLKEGRVREWSDRDASHWELVRS